jgi:predicted nucleic acid-binding protein
LAAYALPIIHIGRCRIVLSDRLLVLDLALEVAFDTNRTVYDCCYLALAMLTGCRLVTADQKLFNALQDGSYAMHVCWVANLP